jgi:hypothetical protein
MLYAHSDIGLSPSDIGLSPSLDHSDIGLSPSLDHSDIGLSPSLDHSDIGLSPSLDHSDIGLKCSQSDIIYIRAIPYQISDILKICVIPPHRFRIVLVVGMVSFYYSEYRISDCSNIGQIHIRLINLIFDIEIQSDIGILRYRTAISMSDISDMKSNMVPSFPHPPGSGYCLQ